jgi:hypothetical protein
MSDLEWLAGIFTIQSVAALFCSQLGITGEHLMSYTEYQMQLASMSWWDVFLSAPWTVITDLINSVPGVNIIYQTIAFSLRMYTFQVPDMPIFFNILWYFMGFIVILCLARFVRGHGG